MDTQTRAAIGSMPHADDSKPRIEWVRDVVKGHQAHVIDGTVLDAFTASAIMTVHNALNDGNKEKYEGRHVLVMAEIAWKLLS
jgi:hypothetical protein